jgi:hypothetical protein
MRATTLIAELSIDPPRACLVVTAGWWQMTHGAMSCAAIHPPVIELGGHAFLLELGSDETVGRTCARSETGSEAERRGPANSDGVT